MTSRSWQLSSPHPVFASLFSIFLYPGQGAACCVHGEGVMCWLVGVFKRFSFPLQVLSHNLCTVLKVPHDPVALEEHFRDDDEGPVSNQGYMPYLNRFILEKV